MMPLSPLLAGFLLAVPLLAETRPHIVYINADDLGWTDLACQGSRYYETPNLDRLAASGAVFTDGYAAAANCAPSRACALSGQWPQRHGIYTVGNSERGKDQARKLIPTTNTNLLADEVLTLPEVLQASGYYTAHLGKWHLGQDPLTQGFQVNIAGFHGGSPSKGGYHSPYKYPNIENPNKGEYLTDRLAQEAARIITVRASQPEPFFLHFATYTVHTPIQPRADLKKKFEGKKGNPRHGNPSYAAMVHSLDQAVGVILATLEKHELLEQTLIIFTSDNGGHRAYTSNAPLRAGKGSYYEGGIREPFFFSWKNHIEAGQTIDTPITNLDLFPTLTAAAAAPIPADKQLDGANLLPLLTSKTALAERALFWHFPVYLEAYRKNDQETRDPLFRTRPGSAIRLGDWKLQHYFEDDAIELYNLREDLSETTDLAKKNPVKAQELLTLLKEWRQSTDAPIPSKPNPDYTTSQPDL